MINLDGIRRTVLTVALLTVALPTAPMAVPAAAGASAPGPCKAATLPIPDNVAMSIVTAADPTGTVIAGRSYPDDSFTRQVVVWQNNQPTKIAFPGVDQEIESLTSGGTTTSGTVGVGTSFADDLVTPGAYLYRGGVVSPLPGGKGASAHGINRHDVIVGDKDGQPVIWPGPTSRPVDLPVPAGFDGGIARAIDDDGTVVGQVFSGELSVGFVWAPDGTGRSLPAPGGQAGRFGYAAYTIRDGWVTGVDLDDPSDTDGLRWDLRGTTVEAVPDFLIRPSAANASGWMVGTDLRGRGLLRTSDSKVILPDVFGHEPGTFSNLPETISDDGRIIAGQADDAGGTTHAAIWRCG